MSRTTTRSVATAAGAQGTIDRQSLGAHGDLQGAGEGAGASPAVEPTLATDEGWSEAFAIAMPAMWSAPRGSSQANPLVTTTEATRDRADSSPARRWMRRIVLTIYRLKRAGKVTGCWYPHGSCGVPPTREFRYALDLYPTRGINLSSEGARPALLRNRAYGKLITGVVSWESKHHDEILAPKGD